MMDICKYIWVRMLLILFALLGYESQAIAQTEVLKRPDQYVFPYEGIDPLGFKSVDEGKVWVVFALNQGTTTTKDIGGNEVFKKLDFMESFYVTQESGEYLEIAKGILEYNEIEEEEIFGWIHKSKLLLWSECYLTQNNLAKKVLLLNNTDEISKGEQIGNKQKSSIEFFNNVSLTGKSIGNYQLFNILYLYKEIDGKYLVGKKGTVGYEGLDAAKMNILGWVDRTRVTDWDTRVAIEPNWNPLSAKERREKGIGVQIFDQKHSAEAFNNGQNVDQAHLFMSITDQFEERKNGTIWRYPIIEEYKEEGLLKVGAMGRISNESGLVNEEINARALRKFNKAMEQKKKINIVFVIDGTSGMQEFYQPVSDAINQASNQLSKTGDILRFGAVFYKDKEAGQVSDVLRLSDNPNEVINFIETYEDGFFDDDEAEAVFKGLEAGIKGTGLSMKETNYIVLIGDTRNHCRDDETQVQQEELVKLINKYSCHLIAIQAENKPTVDYDEFIYQFQDIIQVAAESQYDRYKNADVNRKVAPPRFGEVALSVDGVDKYELSHTASLGVLVIPKSGKKLHVEFLENEIYDVIIGASQKVGGLIKRLEMLAFGGGEQKDQAIEDYMPAILDFIKINADLSQEELNAISFENFQGSKLGYVAIKPNNLEHPLFRYVLFLSTEELGELNAQFEALYFAVQNENSFEQRAALYNTWIEILNVYEGSEESVLAEMTMAEINEKVFGLPNRSSILADVKLKYIKDESVLGPEQFLAYTESIARKANEIKKVYNDPYYGASFTNNSIRYFWLPEELLP